MTANFSSSAIIFPWYTIFKVDRTPPWVAGPSVTFLAMTTASKTLFSISLSQLDTRGEQKLQTCSECWKQNLTEFDTLRLFLSLYIHIYLFVFSLCLCPLPFVFLSLSLSLPLSLSLSLSLFLSPSLSLSLSVSLSVSLSLSLSLSLSFSLYPPSLLLSRSLCYFCSALLWEDKCSFPYSHKRVLRLLISLYKRLSHLAPKYNKKSSSLAFYGKNCPQA